MKITKSASEQNVYFTYMCLVNEIKLDDNQTNTANDKPSYHFHTDDVCRKYSYNNSVYCIRSNYQPLYLGI